MGAVQYILGFDEEAPSAEQLLGLCGEKGLRLRQLTALGLPVPPGFTLTTEAFADFVSSRQVSPRVMAQLDVACRKLRSRCAEFFGETRPMILAVRSGARVSMPGMLLSILNVGLNDVTSETLGEALGDPLAGLRLYLRLLFEFPGQVWETDPVPAMASASNAILELDESDLRERIRARKQALIGVGAPFPESPEEQLRLAIEAVFRSWSSPRAKRYRAALGVLEDTGTAVTVQAMVFGSGPGRSGAGVVFSRRPSDGKAQIFGEFLPGGQGDEVTGGRTTPEAIDVASARARRADLTLERLIPSAFEELTKIAARLEMHYRDLQELEFTVEDGSLFLLQARRGKRAGRAAVKVAVDLANEGVIERMESILRVSPAAFEGLFRGTLPEQEVVEAEGALVLAHGLPASLGAAAGRIVFSADEACRWHERGEEVILVRPDTSADDVHGMRAAAAVVTTSGGLTSHAAVVARSLGKPCLVSAADLSVNEYEKELVSRLSETRLEEGEQITVDGERGVVYRGELPVQPRAAIPEMDALLDWSDAERSLSCWIEGGPLAFAAGPAPPNGAHGVAFSHARPWELGERFWAWPEGDHPLALWWKPSSPCPEVREIFDWLVGEFTEGGKTHSAVPELWLPSQALPALNKIACAEGEAFDAAPRIGMALDAGADLQFSPSGAIEVSRTIIDVTGSAWDETSRSWLQMAFRHLEKETSGAPIGLRIAESGPWVRWAEEHGASFVVSELAELASVRLLAAQTQIALRGGAKGAPRRR